MTTAQPEKPELTSMNINAEQKAKLKSLFPEVFNENKIDFEKLKLTLGEEIDAGEERFGLNWAGKNESYKVIQEPSIATLKPCKEESVNWDSTENLFIEGDNLEALKLLQRSYYGKVKMIYIDPPYNTGKEFIYPDKYSETLDTYLSYTGQTDEKGKKWSSNSDTDGRFHSKWLSMMYPRLFLARNLLKDDGVMFISIDDNEVDNLKKLCNEVFGEENFVAQFIWRKKAGGGNDSIDVAVEHEYIISYKKNSNPISKLPLKKETVEDYKSIDEKIVTHGKYKLKDLNDMSLSDSPGLHFDIKCPDETILLGKEHQWKCNLKTFIERNEDNRIVYKQNKENKWKVYYKIYLNEEKGLLRYDENGNIIQKGRNPESILYKIGLNKIGSDEIKSLFDNIKPFDYPKPSTLIKNFILMSTQNNDIIIDFFAGSCTTAHAVMNLNKEDGGNRKYICVQLPEPCDENSEAFKAGYENIADIGKERIRRVIKKIEEEKAGKLDFAENKQDLGFKVFKLDRSNFKVWDGAIDEKTDIENQIRLAIDHISPNSTEEDLLFELLLKSGFELTTKIKELDLAGKRVFSIEDNALLICLDKELTQDVIVAMARLKPARVICLDDGFKNNDQLKTNAVQTMKSHEVEDFRTV